MIDNIDGIFSHLYIRLVKKFFRFFSISDINVASRVNVFFRFNNASKKVSRLMDFIICYEGLKMEDRKIRKKVFIILCYYCRKGKNAQTRKKK